MTDQALAAGTSDAGLSAFDLFVIARQLYAEEGQGPGAVDPAPAGAS